DPVEILLRLVRLVGQQDGKGARPLHGVAVVLAQRIPGELGISAGLLRIQGDADNRTLFAIHAHALSSIIRRSRAICSGPVPQQPPTMRAPSACQWATWRAEGSRSRSSRKARSPSRSITQFAGTGRKALA